MAGVDSILSTLLQTVSQILKNETKSIMNASADLESFQRELKFIQEFLRRPEGESDEVKEVVKQIHVLVLEAENLIDDFVVKMAKHKRRNLLRGFFRGGELTVLLRSVAAQTKHIRKTIKGVNAIKDKYKITRDEGAVYKRSMIQSRRQNVETEDVVSFENEAESVIEMLDTQDSKREVVSIIGMGGLGKTTLARKIYSGDFVKKFDCVAWVNVSQEYNLKDLLKKIATVVLPSSEMEEFNKLELLLMDNESSTVEGKEKLLVQILRNELAGKRYFIVLDDMWKNMVWDEIEKALPENGKRSRVLITSRVKEVALHASTHTSPYFLPFLNEDDSWKLFSRKVFQDQGCHPDVEEFIKKEILSKCKGLPLAIVVVAGILRRRDQSMWSKVAKELKRYIAQDSSECLGILALSYEELPLHLKPCFLYFGVYPEDFQIPVRQLIRLWVAEGFVDQADNSTCDIEDVAEEYLLELIDRSLIQVVSKRTDGGVKMCRIQGLLLDLAISEGKREMFLSVDRKLDGSLPVTQPRRLSVHYVGGDLLYNYFSEFLQLRSLLSFGDYDNTGIDPTTDPFNHLSKFCRYLRVLDLGEARFCNFLPGVEKLVQLRYLRLNSQNINEIPSSISELVNLEILDVRNVLARKFRLKLWKMQQLRHLNLAGETITSISESNGITKLPNLRTLSGFCLYYKGDAEILKMFPNLKKLGVFCAEADLGVFEHLKRLQRLQTLKIRSKFRFTDPGALPFSLTKITLHHTGLDTSAFSMLGGLPNLQVLKLFNSFRGRKLDTGSDQGQFPRLQVLIMNDLKVEDWSMEGQGFQILVHLCLFNCEKMKAIPDQLKQLSSLCQFKVSWCPGLKESLEQIWVNDPRLIIY